MNKSPTIVILKTGEKLITLIQEAFEGDEENRKGICLVFTHPYVLSLVEVNNTDNPEQDLQVKFSKWCPYSTDVQYKIPYDGVLAIGQPDPGLSLAYQSKIEQAEKIIAENKNAQLQQEEISKVINPEVMPNE
jgi:hypothetical protein